MLLNDLNAAVERKLAAGALEFALDAYQEARMGDSVDEKLAAGKLLHTAAKQALAQLIADQYDPELQPRIGMRLV